MLENEVDTGLIVPTGFTDAVRYLRRTPFLDSPRYRAQQWSAAREGASEDLLTFTDAFVKAFAKLGIPVYPKRLFVSDREQGRLFVTGESVERPGESPFNKGLAVEFEHSTKQELPAVCWELFHHVGDEVAHQHGVDVWWKGNGHFELRK